MLAKIDQVAYQLELPPEAKIHLIFHVSQLKKHVGDHFTQSHLPMIDDEGLIAKEPVAVLDRRLVNRRGRAVTEVLIQWSNCFPKDATWECFYDLKK